MDGKAAWRDNVFVERRWRSVKFEQVSGPATASARRAPGSVGIWNSTTATDRIRALTLERRTTHTSPAAARGSMNFAVVQLSAHPAIVSIIFIRGVYAFHFRHHLDPSRRSYDESRPQRSAGVATGSE
jgi:putative transposase